MRANFRILALSVALTAMVLRALIPAGWMPQAGGSILTLCTIEGQIQIAVGPDGQPLKNTPAKDGEHQFCPFAASSTLASTNTTPVLVAPITAYAAARPPAFATNRTATRHTPQAPRAPPTLS